MSYVYSPTLKQVISTDDLFIIPGSELGYFASNKPTHNDMVEQNYVNLEAVLNPPEEHKTVMVSRRVGRKLVPGTWCYLHKRWE